MKSKTEAAKQLDPDTRSLAQSGSSIEFISGYELGWERALEASAYTALSNALRGIQQMSKDASKGPAHVAKLSLSMMADLAAEALAQVKQG